MSNIRVMKSMELDDEKKLDSPLATDYPFGLRICLTNDELKKLDLDSASAVVGGTVHLHAMACITHVSHNDGPDGYSCRIELQIEKLDVESEDEENEENEGDEKDGY